VGIEPQFDFATAGQILFGAGRLREIGPRAAALGRRALVVTGATPSRARPLLDVLAEERIEAATFCVRGEPTVDTVREGAAAAREAECDLAIGFGGGSAIDAGKAISALATNAGDALDYLEVIGAGRPLTEPPIPYIAIPTTAGTGAEVARNAVLTSVEHRTKVSMRSPLLLPLLAIVDPELTHRLPPDITAYTGLDALTQLIEPLVSARANPLVDGICREGLTRAGRSLRRAYAHGDDVEARTDMSLASLFGGLALTNAGLGAVHGFAGPLGGMLAAPHGAVCGRLLPHVMGANIRLLESERPESPALGRYEQAARILTGRSDAGATDGVAWVTELVSELGVPPLSRYGMTRVDIAEAVEKAARASSMKANPVSLSAGQLRDILAQSL
jgi:alcohol dehydrogenase class IV